MVHSIGFNQPKGRIDGRLPLRPRANPRPRHLSLDAAAPARISGSVRHQRVGEEFGREDRHVTRRHPSTQAAAQPRSVPARLRCDAADRVGWLGSSTARKRAQPRPDCAPLAETLTFQGKLPYCLGYRRLRRKFTVLRDIIFPSHATSSCGAFAAGFLFLVKGNTPCRSAP